MPRRNKLLPYFIIALPAAVALIAAAFWIKSLLAATGEQSVVAEVNGDPVTAAELSHFAKLHRASVIEAYLSLSEDNAVIDEKFWELKQDAGGITPMEKLRNIALGEAVRMKTELQLARELGLVGDISYGSLLEALERENKRREAAAANGEPVYGPARFEESSFIGFYRSKLAASVTELWSENELGSSERELHAFYEEIKTTLSPMEGSLTYETIAIAYRHDGEESDALRENAYRVAEDIRQQLLAGEAEDIAVGSLPTGISVIREGESELNENTASRLYRSENSLYEALRASTAESPVPPVVDDRAAGRYIVARVTGSHAAEPPEYGKVRDIVRRLYAERKYSELINARADAADIKLLPGFYEELAGVR